MDTSKQYIEMCDREEIQKDWMPDAGDFTKNGIVVGLHKLVGESFTLYLIEHGPFKECDCPSHQFNLKRNETTWLPRQDQLQEICLKIWNRSEAKIFLISNLFWAWLYSKNRKPLYKPKSIEQLWLSYHMSFKHRLTWDGKKWRKL